MVVQKVYFSIWSCLSRRIIRRSDDGFLLFEYMAQARAYVRLCLGGKTDNYIIKEWRRKEHE